ncbi:hypothetical protein NTG1052_290124 [Candidatus Nitrotoga sp. 1052]|nr:hypothetical protein NTG1052_290124 [Candidatus Nitrotoga sp. 1052]
MDAMKFKLQLINSLKQFRIILNNGKHFLIYDDLCRAQACALVYLMP